MRGLRGALFCLLLILMGSAAGLLMPVAGPAWAQDAEVAAPDYGAWEREAEQSEEKLTAPDTPTGTLEEIRDRIATWRSRFLAAQNANSGKIAIVRDQITALGAKPAEGETEAPEIATRRDNLEAQLARLQTPGLDAADAYARADGIIREIDATIRDRQADALLKLMPSPLNPINWPEALIAETRIVTGLRDEIVAAWDNPFRRGELSATLPAMLFYLALALILVLRGPRWIGAIARRIDERVSARVRVILVKLLSLGQVALPVIGVTLLVQAVRSSGMAGETGSALLAVLPSVAFVIFVGRWLGMRLFSRETATDAAFSLMPARPAEARFLTNALAVLLALEVFRQAQIGLGDDVMNDAANSVTAFPLLILAGFALFRFGRLLRQQARSETDADDEHQFRNRLIGILGTVLRVVGIAGPLLAAIGYVSAASAVVWPTVLSLGLIGLLLLLQPLLQDVYILASRSDDTARDSLVPVLIGFLLSVLSLPIFALVWGARVADLQEVWALFRAGVSFGDTRISPTVLLTFVLVFALGYAATRLFQGALRSSILPRTRIDKGGQNAIVSGLGYLGIFVAAIVAITAAGIDLSSLAIVAGALSVGIGFGLQNIVSNFVSGIILLIERPISEGDWIEVGTQMGVVKSISVRSTRIETFDRTDVIVPNADLVSGVVTNWTRGNLTGRTIVPVGVAYGTDTRRVEAILREIAEAQPLVVLNPPPAILFIGFGADSLNFEIRAILRDVTFVMAVTSDINHDIARRFGEEGIEIPFAQRDLWLRNPEALGQGGAVPRDDGEQVAAETPRDLPDRSLIQGEGEDGDAGPEEAT